jgi:outer membrane protein OmpA-like peptidoglycan-associated protein
MILFAPDAHAPDAGARTVLTRLVRAIPARAANVRITVTGSSFRVGTVQQARRFSRTRAMATIAWLRQHGPRSLFTARWTVPEPVERPSIRSAVVTVRYVLRPRI